MASEGLKTRKQKLDAWKATERMTKSWLDFLESAPKNQALTDREWFLGWRKHVAATANAPAVPQ